MREIDAQTLKNHGITPLAHIQSSFSVKGVGGCVRMGDIRKYYFSRAGALPGNINFHQNTIVIIFFILISTISL